jgi:hypothetical protein
MKRSIPLIASTMLALVVLLEQAGQLPAQTPTVTPPSVIGIAKPLAGDTQITFRGTTGRAYQVQMRDSVDAAAPWFDAVGAKVIEIQTGVFIAQLPAVPQAAAFYRIVGDGEVIVELKGWNLLVQLSTPANHQYFDKGESAVITVTIVDSFAQGITRNELSTLALYLDGPKDPRLTKSAVKLLGATADRSKTPHHFIDLKTSATVKTNGNTLTYTLQPVSDEAPGTYTASVRAVLGTDAMQQIFRLVDLQIGTTNKETSLVVDANGVNKCAACHLGTLTGKYYLHHIDPSSRSPVGSPSYDSNPVRSCTPCHNNDGYASFKDGTNNLSDAIVLRVHGVHMGEGLKSDFNTNTLTGNFRDYADVVFPADIRNCTACHVDDRWKTQPTRMACGSCHDNVWFGLEASMPTNRVAHSGGDFADDIRCNLMCHQPSTIAGYHQIDPPPYQNAVKLEISTPANGKFFVAGEAPKLTLKISDLATGAAVLATNLVDPAVSTNIQATEWRTVGLYVSGPRADTVPVLTTAAGVTNPTSSTAANDIRYLRDATKRDPRAAWSGDAVVYQLSAITNLASGTYTAYVEVRPGVGQGGWALQNFQIGVTNIEAMLAGNCISCHADMRMHATSRALPMLPDACKSCHDNMHQLTGKTNWSNSQYGFGVAPLARRIHGVHYGNYVAKPNEIISSGDYAHVIFPQDVRNCTKCHSESSSWNDNPTRLACLACHDDDLSVDHAASMTIDPTPQDPWSGDEREICAVCHGSDKAFSPEKVHSISNPYVPIYPRALRE